jgi:Protein of unknown function (DUF3761)
MSAHSNQTRRMPLSFVVVALCASAVAEMARADTPPPGAASPEIPITCKDGTLSASTHGEVCSGHGGVDKTADKSAKTAPMAEPSAIGATTAAKADGVPAKPEQTPPATKTDASMPEVAATGATTASSADSLRKPVTQGNTTPTGATAKCVDGTYSKTKTRQGACSKHGGVSQWIGPQP